MRYNTIIIVNGIENNMIWNNSLYRLIIPNDIIVYLT